MGLYVGTLVQPYETVDMDENHFVGRTCFLAGITDQCIGIIIYLEESDNPVARVRWVQVCPNHLETLTTVTTSSIDDLWEIGQLY